MAYSLRVILRSRIVSTAIRCLGVSFLNCSWRTSRSTVIEFAPVGAENRGNGTAYCLPFRAVSTPLIELSVVLRRIGSSVKFSLSRKVLPPAHKEDAEPTAQSVPVFRSSPPLVDFTVDSKTSVSLEIPGITRKVQSPSTGLSTTGATQRTTGSNPFCLDRRSSPSCTTEMRSSVQELGVSPSASPCTLSKANFEVLSLIGYGHSGTNVQLVRARDSGALYAMKTIDKWALIESRNAGDLKAIDRASAERDLHASVSKELVECPYFVKCFSTFQSSRNLNFILEYCPYDVIEYIEQFGPLDWERALIFIAELAVAVETLHRSHAIHRDIKADNILISTSGHVRLSDFGSSKRLESREGRCDSVIGFSLSIMPPEFFGGIPSYGHAIDWFQVGICAFEVLTGMAPFDGHPIKSAETDKYPPTWPTDISIPDFVKGLVEGLLQPKEELRLKCLQEIRNHEAMASIDWEAVMKEDAKSAPFTRIDLNVPFLTPRMMSSMSSDVDYDPLHFKSFSFVRNQ